MKRVISIILAIVMLVTMSVLFCSCGNRSIGPGKFTFSKIHIFNHDGDDCCLTVEKWYESEVGIEVKTKECGALWLSEGTYMLCEKECPICSSKSGKK